MTATKAAPTAAELFSALMAAASPVEVARLSYRYLRGPLQHVDITDHLTPDAREHLSLPAGRVTLGQLGRALIRHTDKETSR